MMRKTQGFTLIECLVALVIIAIVLASSARAIGLAIEDVKISYEREAASWVAGNLYNQYSLDKVFPDLGNAKKDVAMAGIYFVVSTVISSTPNPYFRRLEISVAKKDQPSYSLFRTVNFLSQY